MKMSISPRWARANKTVVSEQLKVEMQRKMRVLKRHLPSI
jgi:hypothetical protein